MTIISKAPCRISLVGGGTDVNPFAYKYGGKVLNLAISLYHTVSLTPFTNSKVHLKALGEKRQIDNLVETLAYGQDPKFDLIRAIINHFRPKIPSGFSLQVSSPKANALGLGRSGSAGVAIIAAFNAWLQTNLTPLEMGLLASRLEVAELGWPGGKQDSLAAVFGGINLMVFGPGDQVKVKPIKLPAQTITALKQRTFMIFVGGDRHSSTQQKQLVKGMSDKAKLKALFALKNAVLPGITALKQANWSDLGQILHQGWKDKKKSNPSVTNETIDKFYRLARQNNAYGGKISGSGGAGNMFFLIPPEKKSTAIKALVSAGAKLVNFKFDFKGVTIKTTL